jgi:RNA polymerase sigma-70 factor (ECF subfamily)
MIRFVINLKGKRKHRKRTLEKADWQLIVSKYSGLVWQTSYRLLGNYTDTCDCFQDTFVCAFEVSGRQKIRNYGGLLARIATSRSIDMLRKRNGKLRKTTDAEQIEVTAAPNPGPFEQIQSNELGEKLREAISRLPSRDAEAFCMRYLNDMSQKEIAGQLGITNNAAGVLVHRAKMKLQQILESYNNGGR